MRVDGILGHVYPKIRQKTCVDCGICVSKCPALNVPNLEKPAEAYAAWSKEEADYKSSTSGGAASVFSQHIISKGGVVYGCAMLPDIDVRHIRVDNLDGLPKLKGSKYVQSTIVEVIPQLKQDVKNGKPVLFIGTPCQVAAIKALYIQQPENLYLVDLICHGVPSKEMLKRHMHKVADYPHYDKIIFRENKTYLVAVVVDGKVVYRQPLNHPRYKDWYINTFFDGYTCRESCYQCHYARPERVSDITIGDFWGLGKKIPADEIPQHPNGCSVIMPTTNKGKQLVANVSNDMYMYNRSVDEAVAGNDQLRFPVPFTERKKVYCILFPYMGYSAYYIVVFDKYLTYLLRGIKRKIVRKIKG